MKKARRMKEINEQNNAYKKESTWNETSRVQRISKCQIGRDTIVQRKDIRMQHTDTKKTIKERERESTKIGKERKNPLRESKVQKQILAIVGFANLSHYKTCSFMTAQILGACNKGQTWTTTTTTTSSFQKQSPTTEATTARRQQHLESHIKAWTSYSPRCHLRKRMWTTYWLMLSFTLRTKTLIFGVRHFCAKPLMLTAVPKMWTTY